MTTRCGLFGYPLGHSISAVFQQAAFDHLGLNISYQAWETSPEQFVDRFRELRSPDVLGCNVTIPHKEAALRLVDSADPIALAVGAVNTVARRGSRLEGYNTDVAGFLDLMQLDAEVDVDGASVVLLGAGGAARAIGLALGLAGVRRLTIANRTEERAVALWTHLAALPTPVMDGVRTRLADRLGAASDPPAPMQLCVAPWHGSGLATAIAQAQLVVNCTSVGMLGKQRDASPLPADALFGPDAVIIDIVANPLFTRLMQNAANAGHRVVGGLPMLVYQGAESFRIWTDMEPPLDVMRHTAAEHMRSRG